MLKIDNLRFAFPGQNDPYIFDLEVRPGKIVTITGQSGSGKSTLLDLIAGFLMPNAGTMAFDGVDILSLPPEARPVSILFQANNLFDHLTVADNLALALPDPKSKAEQNSKIDQVLENVELAEFRGQRAAKLSGGQKQRVALARTLLLDRPILLLDEPFAALDPETAQSMRQLVRTLAKSQNWCTLVVSHDHADVSGLGAHHCEIRDGRLSSVSKAAKP